MAPQWTVTLGVKYVSLMRSLDAVVNQSGNLTFDADVYYIDFNNKIASIAANSKGAAFDQYTFVPARSWTVSLNADF